MSEETVTCPFCREEGFDLVALKQHLQGNYVFAGACEAYEATPTPQEEQEQRRLANLKAHGPIPKSPAGPASPGRDGGAE